MGHAGRRVRFASSRTWRGIIPHERRQEWGDRSGQAGTLPADPSPALGMTHRLSVFLPSRGGPFGVDALLSASVQAAVLFWEAVRSAGNATARPLSGHRAVPGARWFATSPACTVVGTARPGYPTSFDWGWPGSPVLFVAAATATTGGVVARVDGHECHHCASDLPLDSQYFQQ